jgi:copper chaperone CopZ
MRVRNSLVKLDGVVAVYVDHAIGMAGVRFDPDQVQVQTLIDAVAQAGNDGLHEYGARLAALVGGGRRTTRPEPNAE